MDCFRGSGYAVPIRWKEGSDDTITIRWFRCEPDAKTFPGEHAFGSLIWEGDHRQEWQGPGEVTRDREYRRLKGTGAKGEHFAGEQDWFLTGVPAPHWNDKEDCGILPYFGDLTSDGGYSFDVWGGHPVTEGRWEPWEWTGNLVADGQFTPDVVPPGGFRAELAVACTWNAETPIYGGEIVVEGGSLDQQVVVSESVQSLPSSVGSTTISFESSVPDPSDMWDSGTPYLVTIQAAGSYNLHAAFFLHDEGGVGDLTVSFGLLVNGSEVSTSGQFTFNEFPQSPTFNVDALSLAHADQCKLIVHRIAAPYTVQIDCDWDINRVG